MDRLSTGNPELDGILGGGLPKGSINIVMGVPGSGKTVLAEQFVFANAEAGRPVLYLATLTEPLSKLLQYLQEFSYAKVELVGSQVLYESLVEVLQDGEHAAERLIEHVTSLIQQHSPSAIVFDSFKAIADAIAPSEWRRAVYELAALLGAYDTTTLWLGEYGSDDLAQGLAEFAVADGIIQLGREQLGSRDGRFLRVAKLRGSDARDGKHAYRITGDGLRVFPRLVSPPSAAAYETTSARLQTGIRGLDEMIESGWLRGTSTLVAGPSGAGKTMVGLHFLKEGVERGEAGLLVSFQESPTQIARSMRSLGWKPETLIGPGKLDILYTSPVELQVDTIVLELLHRVAQNDIKRVTIDAVADIERNARDANRFVDYIYALNQMLAARGVTCMLLLELPNDALNRRGSTGREISFMSDNVLLLSLELGQDLARTVRVLKSRGSAHDGRRRSLRITPQGVLVE